MSNHPPSPLVGMLAALVFAGCLSGTPAAAPDADPARESAWPPTDVRWDASGPWSKTLLKGTLEVLPPELHNIKSHDGVRIAAARWRPKVPDGVFVPVILDIGPYWADRIAGPRPNDHDLPFLIEQFVPLGFAYGRVAVRGTSSSSGCMEVFSLNEQKDMDAVVTYFGTQPWSNGNVGLVGGSYDGTTQWEAATFGNPHLKTVLPLAALSSIYDHGHRNGTSWIFGPAFHTWYWIYGFLLGPRSADDRAQNLNCLEGPRGLVTGVHTAATGDRDGPPAVGSDYWKVRDFRDRIKQNYRGSVFLIHGIKDWRVPISQSIPFVTELQAQGLDVKMLLGQWWHDQPDRATRGDHLRWDYAEMLYRWFDRYLRGNAGADTGPVVHVEDNLGNWREEPTWPPADVAWTTYHLGAGVLASASQPTDEAILFNPLALASSNSDRYTNPLNSTGAGLQGKVIEYWASLGRLQRELRFAGLPRLHVTFVPLSPEGSRIYAELIDVGENQHRSIVAHAVMDLRYHTGGYQRQRLTPGQPIVARMEFIPADIVIPAGHELALRIVNGNGYSEPRWTEAYPPVTLNPADNFFPEPTPHPVRIQWGAGKSVLVLPQIERDVGDGRYPGEP